MTEYSGTEPSTFGGRSPLFGTATFSGFSATRTTLSPSRYSSTARSVTPIASSYDSDDASSDRQMRRIVLSPPPSRRPDSDSYYDEDSIDDAAEVERALTMIDSELANTEDVLTEWSHGSSDVGKSSASSHTGLTGSGSGYSGDVYSRTNTLADRGARVLSTISEHTENINSRPTSYSHSGGPSGSRPNTLYAINENPQPVSPTKHVRASTEPSLRPVTPGRVSPPIRGKRTGELIALFEERTIPAHGHIRISSAPMGPRSPSPYTTTSQSRSFPTFTPTTPTSYMYDSSYGSRPSSPTKSSSAPGTGPVTMTSSLLSPGGRYTSTFSNTLTNTQSATRTTTPTYTSTYTGTVTSQATDTLTRTFTTTQSSDTLTATSIRRPQASERSPLSSVRNIVAAWKERTPSLGSKSARSGASPSPTPSDASASLRRRAVGGSIRQRERSSGRRASDSSLLEPPAMGEARGLSEVSFDVNELGQYANARDSQEPERIGLLWYLNVHAPPPYRWQRCQALLYPHMLLLSWIAPGGGRGIVTLDLLNCTEVLSVASPAHPAARDDIGTIAARMQTDEAAMGGGVQPGEMGLVERLCPFQLLYTDGIERLAAESPKERTHWVSAIWDVLQHDAESVPDRSVTRSPTGSVRTMRSVTSTSSTRSGTGSLLTTYIPPLDTIPDLSDLRSMSSRTGPSHRSSLVSAHRTRATDDAAVSGGAYLYPGDPRVIPPSRSSSLRRTSSLTDLDEGFTSALRRARESRPGLGFGLGLAAGIPIGDGSPVTVSSGPHLGRNVFMSPPPSSVGRGSEKAKSLISDSAASESDEAFFSARSRTNGTTMTPYSLSSYSRGITNTNTETTTGLITDETVHVTSSSGTEIIASTLSLRGPTSNSYLGDSHDSRSNTSGSYSVTSPSRSALSRSGGIRRRTLTPATRSYTTSYVGSGEESSDKENTDTYPSRDSRSVTFSTLDSYTRTGTFTGTYTPSGSYTPTQTYDRTPESRSVESRPESRTDSRTDSRMDSRTDSRTDLRAAEEESTPPTSDYFTAKTPSSPSFVSLDTIPSESDYETADVCSTTYETAPKCPTEPEPSEYDTAEICPTEPPPSEYVTAEVCPTEVSTEYETAQCKCAKPEEDTISIEVPPSEIPSIPEEVEPENVALPPSLPVSMYSPSTLSRELLEGPETPRMEPVPTPSTELPSESLEEDLLSTPSIPGPSPIPPSESPLQLTQSPSSVSSPTETSVTPTPSSMLTPTVSSTVEQPPTPSSPAIPESMWGAESDESYDSSLLRASPSVQSLAAPEGLDNSFETSFLRPSHTITPSPQLTLMTPITEEISSESMTIPSSPLSPSLTPTPSSVSLPITESGLSPSLSLSPTSTPVSTEMMVRLTPSPSLTPTLSSTEMVSGPQPPPSPSPSFSLSPSLTPTLSSTEMVSGPPPPPSPSPSLSLSPSLTPTPVSAEIVSGLTRTPSSVSSVSMSSSVLYPRSLLDVPSIIEPESEPSLLSTARSLSPFRMRPISPRGVPLPPSPTPSQAPSVSMSVSLTTPHREAPSIRSQLDTVVSEAPSAILTHDVNRLLQYLHDTDNVRGEQNRDLADNVQALRDDVADLADYLHRVCPPKSPSPPQPPPPQLAPQSQVQLRHDEAPPPLPRKDRSVGGSSIISGPATPRVATPTEAAPRVASLTIATPRITPAGPRPGFKATMIPYETPYRLPSPASSESDVISFLSSYHSDDMSLMESETYPIQPMQRMRAPSPSSPSWPSDSSPSPESTPVSSSVSLPMTSEPGDVPRMPAPIHMPVPVPVPVQMRVPTPVPTESAAPTPVPSSPTPSSDSGTARPIVTLNLGDLRDMIDNIRQRVEGLSNAQDAANRGIDELRGRPVEVGLAECCEKIQRIEDALQRLLNLSQQPRAPPTDLGSEAMYPSDESLLRNLMDAARGDRASIEVPPLHAPVARHPMPTFEETLADMMTPSQPPLQQPPLQEPPPIIPLRYRPGPRTTRPRSASPIFEEDLPPRPGTFPQPAAVPRVYPPRMPRRPLAQRRAQPPSEYPESVPAPSQAGTYPLEDTRPTSRPARQPPEGPDIDMLSEIHRRRAQRHPDLSDGAFRVRPTTAPPGIVYPPVPPPGPIPAPGVSAGPPPSFASVPAAPTVLQLPLTFNDLVSLLRDNRDATLASIEQQQEITRYLTDLNHWLGRDVHDRHQELRSVHERLNDLGSRLDSIHTGQRQDEGGSTRITVAPPPGPGVIPPPPVMTGVMPSPMQQTRMPESEYQYPYSRTPTPPFTPVIPGVIPPQPQPEMQPHFVPVVPEYPQTGPPTIIQPWGQQPQTHMEEPEFIPPAPRRSEEYSDDDRSPGRRITVIPPPPGQQLPQPITVIPPPPGPGLVPAEEPSVVPMPPSVPDYPPSRPESYYEPGIPEVHRAPMQPMEPREPRMGSASDGAAPQPGITILPPPMTQQPPYVVQAPPPVDVERQPSSRRSPVQRGPTTVVIPRSPRSSPRTPSQRSYRDGQSPPREPIIIQPQPPYPGPAPGMPVPYGAPISVPQPRSPSGRRSPPPILIRTSRTPSPMYDPGRSPTPRSRRPTYDEGDRGYSPLPAEHTAPSRRSPPYYEESPRPSRAPTLVEHHPGEPVIIRAPSSRRAPSQRPLSPGFYPEDDGRYPGMARPPRTPSYDDAGRPIRPRPSESEYEPERRPSQRGPSIRRSPPPREEEDPGGYDPERRRPPRSERPVRRPTPIEESPQPTVIRTGSPPVHVLPGGPAHSLEPTIIQVEEGAQPVPSPRAGVSRRRSTRQPSRVTSYRYSGEPEYEPAEAEHVRMSRSTPSDVSERERAYAADRTPAITRVPTAASARTPRPPRTPRTAPPPDEERDEADAPEEPEESEGPHEETHEEPRAAAPEVRRVPTRPPTGPPTAGTVSPSEYSREPLPVPEPEPSYTPMEAEHVPFEQEPVPRGGEYDAPRSEVQTRPITGLDDLGFADAERERADRFGELERQLTGTIEAITDSERQRDEDFRQNEDERDRIFAEHEEQRNREAQERREAILRELEGRIEERLATIEPRPVPVPPVVEPTEPAAPVDLEEPAETLEPEPAPVVEEEELGPAEGSPGVSPALETQSVLEAARRHAEEVAEIVRLEREQQAQDRDAERLERERLQAERDAEHARRVEELEARVRALEEEAAAARAELENERQLRTSEDAENRERDRQMQTEQFETLRNQMLDFTNIATGLQDDMVRKREMMEQRYQLEDQRFEEKREWHDNNGSRWEEVKNMVQQIITEREADRAAQEGSPTLQMIMDELANCKTDMREQLENMSESWRAMCTEYHERTLEAMRENSQQQVQFNVQGYLNDFSKSLAVEVRTLLGEVGDLREKRRVAEYELGCLLKMRAKYEPGGHFNADWRPPGAQDGPCGVPPAPAPSEPAPPPPPEPAPGPARPAWRSVRQGGRRSRRNQPAAPAPPPPEAPPPQTQPPMSWLTWQPDPNFVPTPPTVEPTLLAPPEQSPGLFGPRSPRSMMGR